MEIQGLKEVKQRLLDMGAKAGKSIVRKGLRSGAKEFLQAAKANAPVKTGALKASIKIRSVRSRNKIKFVVGIGKKWFQGDQFYGAFQEWGFKHGSRKLGDARKTIAGKHFMEKAFAMKKEAAVDTAEKTILDGLLKAAEGKGE